MSGGSADPSNTHVDRAGELLRAWMLDSARDEEALADPAMIDALLVIDAFRRRFVEPLGAVTQRVSQLASQELGREAQVTNRLKRNRAILLKLVFERRLRLSQMEDVGGCRLQLPDAAGVRAVGAAIEAAWPGAKVDDYVAAPKRTGYAPST